MKTAHNESRFFSSKTLLNRRVFTVSLVMVLTVCSLQFFVVSARAAVGVNRQINFQGKLVDNNGLNVADGSYTVVFTLYDAGSSGTTLWTETDSVTTSAGIFQVALGAGTALPDSVYFNQDNLYLGIKVGADAEMTPRVRFTAVPYALNAASLNGMVASQSATGFNLQGGTSSKSTVAFTTSGGTLTMQPGVAGGLTIDTNGSNALLLGSSANGITFGGSNNPGYTFSGTGGLTFANGGNNNLTFGSNAGNGTFVIQPNAGGQAALIVNKQGGNDIFTASAAGTTKFTIGTTGNISATGTLTGLTGLTSSGTVTFSNAAFTGNNAVMYGTATTGVLNTAVTSTSNQCLLSGGSAPVWGTCALGTNYVQRNLGAISPANITDDLLLGGTSTSSAKFAFINNVGSGEPTASIAGSITLRNGTGLINRLNGGSINFQTSVGGDAGLSTKLFIANNGTIGIGTNNTNPFATLDVRNNIGTIPAASFSGQSSFASMVVDNSGVGDLFTASKSGATKFVIDNSGNVGINGVTIPQSTLDVNGTIRATTQLNFTSAVAGQVQNVTPGGFLDFKTAAGIGAITFDPNATETLRLTPAGLIAAGVSGNNPLATLDLKARSGTLPTASISGATAFAGMVVDNSGVGDLFTASKSGATKFVINNAGVVGVGTALPTLADKLQVAATGVLTKDLVQIGNIAGQEPTLDGINALQINWLAKPATGNMSSGQKIAVTNSNTVTAGQVQALRLTTNGAGTAIASDTVGLYIDGLVNASTGTTGQNAIEIGANWDSSLFGQGDLRINAAGNIILATSSATTKIGIGTTSPLGTFDVRGNSATTPVATFSGSTNFAAMVVNNSGNGDLFTASKSGASKFVIANNGNVGIGNANPTALVDILNNSATTTLKIKNTVTTSSSTVDMYNDNESSHLGLGINNTGTGTYAGWGFLWNYNSGGLRFGANNAEAMRVETNGNLSVDNSILPNAAPTATSFTAYSGVVDSGTNVGSSSATTVGSDGFPVTAYYDIGNKDLKVAHCTTIDCTSAGTPVTVDSTGDVGSQNSIAMGSDGFPIISEYDQTNMDLKVVHCGTITCSSGNTITSVDTTGNVGMYTSLKIGVDKFAIISYYDFTNGDMKVLHCGNTNCSSGNTITSVDTTNNVGQYTSMIIEQDSMPYITYYDVTNGDLRGARCTTITCSSSTLTAIEATNNVGQYTSVALGKDNFPIISFYDVTNGDMKVLHCGNTFCSAGNTSTSIDTTNNVGQWSAIAVPPSGFPVVYYYDVTNADVRKAVCSNIACTLLTVNSPVTTGNVGQYISVTVTQTGGTFVTFYDATNGHLDDLSFPSVLNNSSGYTGGSDIGSRTNYFNNVFAAQYWGKEFQIQNFDVAEDYKAEDPSIEPGDIVCVAPDGGTNITKSDKAYASNILGIISTDPAIRLGNWEASDAALMRPVALVGRIPVKIATDSAAIQPGDLLTSSDIPGRAMKALHSGSTIGKALEGWTPDSGQDTILVFANLSDANAAVTLTDGGDISFYGKPVDSASASAEIDSTLVALNASASAQLTTISGAVTSLQSQVSSLSAIVDEMKMQNEIAKKDSPLDSYQGLSLINSATLSGSLRVQGDGLIEGMLHVVGTIMTQNFIVNNMADFFGPVIFHNDIAIQGTPTFNSDTAGVAIIKKGDDHIDIIFAKAYQDIPVVNVSLIIDQITKAPNQTDDQLEAAQKALEKAILEDSFKFIITKRSTKGFTIRMSKPADDDTTFTWAAILVDRAKRTSYINTVPTKPEDLFSPTPVETGPTLIPSSIPQSGSGQEGGDTQ